MKGFILLLFTLLCGLSYSQLGIYTATVTSTITTSAVQPYSIGDVFQFCVTVEDFTGSVASGGSSWFDAFEIELTGATLVSYDSGPGAGAGGNWVQEPNDMVGSGLGWGFDYFGAAILAFNVNDWGDYSVGPWEFCFTIELSGGVASVDVSLWGDYDTGSWTGTGFGNIYDPDGPYNIFSDGVLPIELISFDGRNVSEGANELTWVTASEFENDYFILERSLDALNWETISKTDGSGHSIEEIFYYYIDSYFRDTINYYKLTQVDFNGDHETFNIILIDNRKINKEVLHVSNMLGQKISMYSNEMKFIVYTDGSTKRMY